MDLTNATSDGNPSKELQLWPLIRVMAKNIEEDEASWRMTLHLKSEKYKGFFHPLSLVKI